MLNLFGQTAQIFRPVKTEDGFGDHARDVWPTTPSQTAKCRLQWVNGYEQTDNRDVAVGQWKLFLPPDSPASENDRVAVDGKWFEVVTVYPVHSPRGLHHYELNLSTYSGEVPRG